jgi:hypothetical protein
MAQKIVSLELPEDSTYRIMKTQAIKDSFWIETGHIVVGELNSNPIKVGQRCNVSSLNNWRDSLSTSFVVDIELDKTNKRKVILHTENSIYTLEEIDV